MDPWRAWFLAARQRMQEEADEDEFILSLILGLQSVEDVPPPRVVGGSRPGRRGNIERDRLQMHAWMMKDYFSDNLVYGPSHFRRRFRMQRSLFETIMERVCEHDRCFVQKVDATGLLELSPH
jgi:hypothetical protein